MTKPIAVQNFSHVCIGVSDIEASLAFYTAVLGMDVVFDVELEGAGLDAVTGGAAQNGRMIGGLIGGAMVELLFLGKLPAGQIGRAHVELQSHVNLVCRLLLEKKNKKI